MREFLPRGDKKAPPQEVTCGEAITAPHQTEMPNFEGNFDLPAPVVSEEAMPSCRFLCLVKWALNGPITAQSTASKGPFLLVAARIGVMDAASAFLVHDLAYEKRALRPSVPIQVVQSQ
jgi:hypothetical protein